MIEIVYYNDWLRCYRNGNVERLFRGLYWREVENTDNCNGYNYINIEKKAIRRHRLIAFCWLALKDIEGESGGTEPIDHINGNRLNNATDNLRIVTNQQNNWNQTKAKGYYWYEQTNKWKAQIQVNGKQIHIGYFEQEGDARQAYLDAKLLYHVF